MALTWMFPQDFFVRLSKQKIRRGDHSVHGGVKQAVHFSIVALSGLFTPRYAVFLRDCGRIAPDGEM
jgi:hypothetical protein